MHRLCSLDRCARGVNWYCPAPFAFVLCCGPGRVTKPGHKFFFFIILFILVIGLGTALTLYMLVLIRILAIFIVAVFSRVVLIEDGYPNFEETCTAATGIGQTSLASTRQRVPNFVVETACIYQNQTSSSSFARPGVVAQNLNSNVEESERSLALLELQQVKSVQYTLLWRLGRALGRFYGPYLCTAQPTTAAEASTVVFCTTTSVGIVPEIILYMDAKRDLAEPRLGRLGAIVHFVTQFISQKIYLHSRRGHDQNIVRNAINGIKGQKGKGKNAIEPPPWSSSAQQPPAPPIATPGQSRAEVKLQEIVTVLKKKDDPELQTLAKSADVLNTKTATSKLHKAVTRHGDVKTAVSWRQYLESAIETWRSFIEDFDKEDRRLEELIGKADADLSTAQLRTR